MFWILTYNINFEINEICVNLVKYELEVLNGQTLRHLIVSSVSIYKINLTLTCLEPFLWKVQVDNFKVENIAILFQCLQKHNITKFTIATTYKYKSKYVTIIWHCQKQFYKQIKMFQEYILIYKWNVKMTIPYMIWTISFK
jgi:hypothetical protein